MMSALSLAFAGCATIRKTGAAQDSRICLSEVNNSGCDRAYRIIHGKLRPFGTSAGQICYRESFD